MDGRSGWKRFRSGLSGLLVCLVAVGVPALVGYRCRHETWVAVMIVAAAMGTAILFIVGRHGWVERAESALLFPVVMGWLFTIVVKPILMLVSAVHRHLGG